MVGWEKEGRKGGREEGRKEGMDGGGEGGMYVCMDGWMEEI